MPYVCECVHVYALVRVCHVCEEDIFSANTFFFFLSNLSVARVTTCCLYALLLETLEQQKRSGFDVGFESSFSMLVMLLYTYPSPTFSFMFSGSIFAFGMPDSEIRTITRPVNQSFIFKLVYSPLFKRQSVELSHNEVKPDVKTNAINQLVARGSFSM